MLQYCLSELVTSLCEGLISPILDSTKKLTTIHAEKKKKKEKSESELFFFFVKIRYSSNELLTHFCTFTATFHQE